MTITPPPDDVIQEMLRTAPHPSNQREHYHYITLCAAQWGADQELEATCQWLRQEGKLHTLAMLRAARRPKPPSLKQQSLALIDLIQGNEKGWDIRDLDVVRRALEAMPDDQA